MADYDQRDETVFGAVDIEHVFLGACLTDMNVLGDSTLSGDDFENPTIGALFARMQERQQLNLGVSQTLLADEFPEHVRLIWSATDLMSELPLAAHHEEAIRDRAVRRALLVASMRIAAIARGNDMTDIVDRARAEVDKALRGDEIQLTSMLVDARKVLAEHRQHLSVVPSPWEKLNDVIEGFAPGRMYIFGARPGVGKALALDTPILTTNGWSTMGELEVGDYVYGANGKPTRITAATEVMTGRPCYAVTMSTGSVIVADAEHQWFTETRSNRKARNALATIGARTSMFSRDQRTGGEMGSVKTTRDIAVTLLGTSAEGRLNHSIPVAPAVDGGSRVELPIDPYILGYWLGDGDSAGARITVHGPDTGSLLYQMGRVGYFTSMGKPSGPTNHIGFSTMPIRRGGGVKDCAVVRLRAMGVLLNKHIPEDYLRASIRDREALLAGLIDSDGTVNSVSGRVSIDVTSRPLAEGIAKLSRSLGFVTVVGTRRVLGRTEASSICYRIGFTPDRVVSRLARKAERMCKRPHRKMDRFIADVQPISSVPVRCIEVDAEDHLYLAGEELVPTHNSAVASQIAYELAAHGPVVFATMEMDKGEVYSRIVAQQAEVYYGTMKGGPSPFGVQKEASFLDTGLRDIRVVDSGTQSVSSIRTAVRAASRDGHVAGLIVDYIHLLTTKAGETENIRIGEITRGLKQLAMDFKIPVIALSQLNRAVTSRDGGKPSLADLRGSGSLEQDGDAVIFLYRDEDTHGQYDDELKVYVGKNRQGPGFVDLTLRWHGEFVKAVN